MDTLNEIFDSLNRSLSAFDLENPIWAATASLLVALTAYGLYRLWRRFINKIKTKVEEGRSSWIKPLRFQKLDLLAADDIATLLGDDGHIGRYPGDLFFLACGGHHHRVQSKHRGKLHIGNAVHRHHQKHRPGRLHDPAVPRR